jgi:hypothetical protein
VTQKCSLRGVDVPRARAAKKFKGKSDKRNEEQRELSQWVRGRAPSGEQLLFYI